MKSGLPYDHTDPSSIERYAQRLLNRSLKKVLGEEELSKYSFKGKGSLGQMLEKAYFKYTPNSLSKPDFEEAGVELKSNPLKRINRGLVSKERLVLNIINFEEVDGGNFVVE